MNKTLSRILWIVAGVLAFTALFLPMPPSAVCP